MPSSREFKIAAVFFPLIDKLDNYKDSHFNEIAELAATCLVDYENISVEYLSKLPHQEFKKIILKLYEDVKMLDSLW
ncbi:Uncharacterised protein, partial [Metamycoplasma alkalescens]